MTALEQKLADALELEQTNREAEQIALVELLNELSKIVQNVSNQQGEIIKLLQKEDEGESLSEQLSKALAPFFMSLQMNLKEELATLLKKP